MYIQFTCVLTMVTKNTLSLETVEKVNLRLFEDEAAIS